MIEIFSDGGGERGSTAAAACIIDTGSTRLQLVGFLGPATNNEAEIFAGLLAFAALPLVVNAESEKAVRWYCDSEYVLKSACEYIKTWQRNGWKTAAKKPVKNQSLWRVYLELARGYVVTPTHVYGHTGHPENESCDSAATWARAHGQNQLALHGNGALLPLSAAHAQGDWYLIDGREFLGHLREREEEELDSKEVRRLSVTLKSLKIGGKTVAPISAEMLAAKSFSQCIEKLQCIEAELAELSPNFPKATLLRAAIKRGLAEVK